MKRLLPLILILCSSALSGQSLFQREVRLDNDTFASYFVIRDIVQKDANSFKVLGYYENERSTYTYGNFVADMDLEGNLSGFVFYRSMIPAYTLIKSSKGGYIMAGDNIDIAFMARIDDNGKIIWQQHYDNGNEVEAYDVVETSSGDLVFAGEINEHNDFHLLVKTDSRGDTLWTRSFVEHGESFDLTLLPDDGTVSVGNGNQSQGFGRDDFVISRFDKDGNQLWAKLIGHEETQYADKVISTKDGSILMAGTTHYVPADNMPNNRDPMFVKLDMQGNVLWYKSFDYRNGKDYLKELLEDENGNYIAAIYHYDLIDSTSSVILMALSPSGQLLWSREFNENLNFRSVKKLVKSPDGGYIISARVFYYASDRNKARTTYLIKTDSEGKSCLGKSIAMTESQHHFQSKDVDDLQWFQKEAYPSSFRDGVDTSFELTIQCYCRARAIAVDDENLLLFPNPNQGIFQLYREGCENNDFSVRVFNAMGQEVYRLEGASAEALGRQFNLPLAAGVYLLRFESGEEELMRKFVIY